MILLHYIVYDILMMHDSLSTANNHSPSSPRPAARPGRAQPASQEVNLPYHAVIWPRNTTGSQLELPIFARTRLSPLTLAAVHARLRKRVSGL